MPDLTERASNRSRHGLLPFAEPAGVRLMRARPLAGSLPKLTRPKNDRVHTPIWGLRPRRSSLTLPCAAVSDCWAIAVYEYTP